MIKNQAFKIIQQYIESWLKQDITLFTSTLHHDSIIKECNGHLFKGRDDHIRWFKEWNRNSNRVTHWEILSFSFDPEADTCAFEWDFNCQYKEKDYSFYGCSFVELSDDSIFRLYEYEMNKTEFLPYNQHNNA